MQKYDLLDLLEQADVSHCKISRIHPLGTMVISAACGNPVQPLSMVCPFLDHTAGVFNIIKAYEHFCFVNTNTL